MYRYFVAARIRWIFARLNAGDREAMLNSLAPHFTYRLRAVGDFEFFGFLKKVRGTRFTRWDAHLFSPLCLLLGLAATLVAPVSLGRRGVL